MYAIVVFVLLHKQPWQRAAIVYTFSGKNLCICMLFDAKNSATYFEYNQLIRNSHSDVCLINCDLCCASCGCMFAILGRNGV